MSFRTLVLMLLLFGSIVTHQYVNYIPSAEADVIWLAGDCLNEPLEPQPESTIGALERSVLDDDPNEPEEPQPEST